MFYALDTSLKELVELIQVVTCGIMVEQGSMLIATFLEACSRHSILLQHLSDLPKCIILAAVSLSATEGGVQLP